MRSTSVSLLPTNCLNDRKDEFETHRKTVCTRPSTRSSSSVPRSAPPALLPLLPAPDTERGFASPRSGNKTRKTHHSRLESPFQLMWGVGRGRPNGWVQAKRSVGLPSFTVGCSTTTGVLTAYKSKIKHRDLLLREHDLNSLQSHPCSNAAATPLSTSIVPLSCLKRTSEDPCFHPPLFPPSRVHHAQPMFISLASSTRSSM